MADSDPLNNPPRRAIVHAASGKFGIIDSRLRDASGEIEPAGKSYDEGILDNPMSHLHEVYLHADFDYWRISYDQSVTLSLPARGRGNGEATHTPFPAHNFGIVPWAVMRIAGKQLPAGGIVQAGGFDGVRCLFFESDAAGFYVRERWMNDDSNDTPAVTLTLRAIAYQIAASGGHPMPLHFQSSTGRLRAAFGKFDTDNRYLRRDTVAPDFWMTAGTTLDSYQNTLRQVLPNGETIDINGYSGSFAGTGFWGVAD